MSNSASTMGFPVLRDSRLAKLSAFCRIFSASLNRIRPRSCAVVFDHGPESKAARAAFTAASTSALSAALTRAITSSVEGSDREGFSRRAGHPLAVHVILISSHFGLCHARHHILPIPATIVLIAPRRAALTRLQPLPLPCARLFSGHTQKRKTPPSPQIPACRQTSIFH